jgi:phosphatidylglycerol lysyltransferase
MAGFMVFVAALDVLRWQLHGVTWRTLSADLSAIAPKALALAVGLTALNYVTLMGYDVLAVAYARTRLPIRRIALASFLAYAIANNVGFALLTGSSIRYRFYARWGVTPSELSRIVLACAVTFWLGLCAFGGLSLVRHPPQIAQFAAVTTMSRPVGALLVALPLAYVMMAFLRRAPLRIGAFELPLPPVSIAVGQLLISAVDWALAGAVLYVLLPSSDLVFTQFLGLFLVAILIGLLSHVPGGVGVFEGLMIVLLQPFLSSSELLPALVVFRGVYYLLPLFVALITLVGDEVWQRRAHLQRAGVLMGRLTEQLTPTLLALFTFIAGIVLLFSSATPAAPGRLELIDRVLPLGVIEASHLLGSVIGAGLLILSQGLARRLDAAYYLTAMAMTAGMVTSLLKGFDYEEASLLLVVLLVLRRARPAFDRRAAFFDTRFTPPWIAAMAGALVASIWLGLFAFKHIDYSNQLWWQFELHGEASRFLRASVAAVVVLLLFAFARLIAIAPPDALEPTAEDLDAAAAVIARQGATMPFLALLGDKSLVFNDERTAFLMYAVQGRTWVVMGDPVGWPAAFPDLIRRFLERCDDFGGVPVFYEVGAEYLHLYADFGLTFAKLGEKATVDLETFTLEGSRGARYRQLLKRLEKDGGRFRVVPAAGVPILLDDLRAVSDDWLAARAGAEKGFSLGFFDRAYLSRFPVALVESDDRIWAFANILPGPTSEELSIDLMRYHQTAPRNVMEALCVHIMVWGRDQGYRRFVLGMAPLSGFEASPVASLWHRVGSFLYEHSGQVYNFQGLRAYKEKFNPTWAPHYLAYPGGFRLPRIMTDVSALIAGGYRHIFRK